MATNAITIINLPQNTYENQPAERAAIADLLAASKVPEGLRPKDFTHDIFRGIFEKAMKLNAEGKPCDPVHMGILPEEAEKFDDPRWIPLNTDELVEVLRERTYRRELRDATGAWLLADGAENSATAELVAMAAKKRDELLLKAKPFADLVEQYVPSLAQKAVDWKSLATEDDIIKQQGATLDYIVDEIAPRHRVTMLFGQEKSGKSIIALDLLKHIANGLPWLGRKTVKTPCLYIDLEDGILGCYCEWIKGVGEEKIRFITIRSPNGIPHLDEASLLSVCKEMQPVIVLDSLHKLFTREKDRKTASGWNAGDYEPVLERIRQLCVAGATVILIHHSTKADQERYRDSSAIGANVDFLFAVVGDEPKNGIKRIELRGKPSRGAQPPTINILAFPHIKNHGHLCLDAGLEESEINALGAAEEIKNNGPAESRTALWKRMGGNKSNTLTAIRAAIEKGYLIESDSKEINVGSLPLSTPKLSLVPTFQDDSGTDFGTDEDAPPF